MGHENQESLPEDDPEPDALVVKNIGEAVLREFIHDDFIDGLDRSIKYPEDAP